MLFNNLKREEKLQIYIERILNYSIEKQMSLEYDKLFLRNRLLDIIGLNEFTLEDDVVNNILDSSEFKTKNIYQIMDELKSLSFNNKFSDWLDSKIFGEIMPRPSIVINEFWNKYDKNPKLATDFLYKLSIDSNYIRKNRTDKNIIWNYNSKYGDLKITINVSKPEKDIEEIKKAKLFESNAYPKCPICKENEGYEGRINSPARQNLRIIPIKLNEEKWCLQFSPYSYYNQHCIVLKSKHEPMKISKFTFHRLFDFLDLFNHYFIGSNSDLPIVGGSILNHDHFQGGENIFPMDKAKVKKEIYTFDKLVKLEILDWPLSVIKIKSKYRSKINKIAEILLENWIQYNNSDLNIISHTGEERHNAITPILRKVNDYYIMYIVFRNNRCDKNRPKGIFHTRESIHNIKKENIGLIEVMGLGILPKRLLKEMDIIKKELNGESISSEEIIKIEKHHSFIKELKKDINKKENQCLDLDELIRNKIGCKFLLALEDTAVFKGSRGYEEFIKFINKSLNNSGVNL